MSEFKKKLRAVFDKGTEIDAVTPSGALIRDRYVPQSLNGGTGWRVYDRKRKRFLSNKEVKKTPLHELVNEPLAVN